MLCLECKQQEATRLDPRQPPAWELRVCLCLDCFTSAANERIEELQNEIDELREQIEEE